MLEKKELQKREANILPTISNLGVLRFSTCAYRKELQVSKQKAPQGKQRPDSKLGRDRGWNSGPIKVKGKHLEIQMKTSQKDNKVDRIKGYALRLGKTVKQVPKLSPGWIKMILHYTSSTSRDGEKNMVPLEGQHDPQPPPTIFILISNH